MISILINSQKDTDFLRGAYEGLEEGNTILVNPTREKVEEVLTEHPNERVMLMGHGSPSGLFSNNWMGYIVDFKNAYLLKDREVIGIWCWAKAFGKAHGLKGFFTDMFISNYGEYRGRFPNGIEYKDEDIFAEITNFVTLVNTYLKEDKPLDEWVEDMRNSADYTKNFVEYNYDGLEYLDGTQEVTSVSPSYTYSASTEVEETDIVDEYYENFRAEITSTELMDMSIEEIMRYAFKKGFESGADSVIDFNTEFYAG